MGGRWEQLAVVRWQAGQLDLSAALGTPSEHQPPPRPGSGAPKM